MMGEAAGGGEANGAPGFVLREAEGCLWPGEKLTVEEIGRRRLLEHLLLAESERGMVESVRA